MVSRRKEGNSVRYAMVVWSGWWLVEQMAMSVADQLSELRQWFAPDRRRVAYRCMDVRPGPRGRAECAGGLGAPL